MSNRLTLKQAMEMPLGAVATLPTEQIALLAEELTNAKAAVTADDAFLQAVYGQRIIPLALTDLPEGHGTSTFKMDGVTVKVTVPKRVKWDHHALHKAAQTVAEWGEDVAEYIKIEYDVSEKAYSVWPSKIRNVFAPARTVETGKPTVKFYGVA
jgi:hypothetical protein